MNKHSKFRKERDPLGEKNVPFAAYYGIQTARAIENFTISGISPKKEFISAFEMVKKAAAVANMATGSLNVRIGRAIIKAADEIIKGKLHAEFVVDAYQAGTGINTHPAYRKNAIKALKGYYRDKGFDASG